LKWLVVGLGKESQLVWELKQSQLLRVWGKKKREEKGHCGGKWYCLKRAADLTGLLQRASCALVDQVEVLMCWNKKNVITSITCCLVTWICSILYIALGVVIVYSMWISWLKNSWASHWFLLINQGNNIPVKLSNKLAECADVNR
jgi:hypothetical protein